MGKQPSVQASRVRAAVASLEPVLRRAFETAISRAAAAVDQRALLVALEAGNVEAAVQLLHLNRAVLFPLDDAVRAGFVAGGAAITADLPRGLSGRFDFDGRHHRAEAWVRANAGSLIQGIQAESEQATRLVVGEALKEGRSHVKVAREITGRTVGSRRVGGYLGLTVEQTQHVMNARAMLADPARIGDYFVRDAKTGRSVPRYKLSDRRYDRAVKQAIAEGRALSARHLDAVVQAHRAKALSYRGKLIAKNEAHTAQAAGREEAFTQVAEDPEVEAVTVRWQHNLSTSPREDHVAMNGTVITLGETFEFGGVRMKHPHDPAGGAAHSVHCRCVAVYRAKLRRDVHG